jgi:hypothetical protein
MTGNDLRSRLVPAICTQCGAKLEIDPTQDAAVCPYCSTPFIVEKAVQNYAVQHANIDHVDKVEIDMKGAADSLFGFLGNQLSESREIRREERRERREADREIEKGFLKIFGYMMIGMFVFALVAFLIMNLTGGADAASVTASGIAETSASQQLPSGDGQSAGFQLEGDVHVDIAPGK